MIESGVGSRESGVILDLQINSLLRRSNMSVEIKIQISMVPRRGATLTSTFWKSQIDSDFSIMPNRIVAVQECDATTV